MTVCIAAVCENKTIGDAKIVLCTDGKGSGPLGSREFVMKDRFLTPSWRCLTAGGDNDLNALIPLLQKRMMEQKPLDEMTVPAVLRDALGDLKLVRCNEYTRGRYGLGYADFLRDGKAMFPDDQFRSDIFAISNITLNVDCIVAGFQDDGFPMLLQLDGKGGVNIKEDFAVAGEGGYLAESGLTHRQHIDTLPLGRTLYCVYEAKRYAERISGVNEVTHMTVLTRTGYNFVRQEGREHLQALFDEYAPRPISKSVDVEKVVMRPALNEPALGPKAP